MIHSRSNVALEKVDNGNQTVLETTPLPKTVKLKTKTPLIKQSLSSIIPSLMNR
jgi:hypothetical protein